MKKNITPYTEKAMVSVDNGDELIEQDILSIGSLLSFLDLVIDC